MAAVTYLGVQQVEEHDDCKLPFDVGTTKLKYMTAVSYLGVQQS